ncbi:Aste57867_16860 [Aphanomyces stellatus]|uniref:Aste57867_16860 protein n=1 Tax=Aphanomyces stellatus TaxID=120398 RepID=A0A485L7L1_9STRA|nr:hypothetical protein As57867_016802 [Aphanomyces stellatus]VFT93624.1 Aste57867_16860 [Aphanomyces stellatus]
MHRNTVFPGTIAIGADRFYCLEAPTKSYLDAPTGRPCNGQVPAQQWTWVNAKYLYNAFTKKCLTFPKDDPKQALVLRMTTCLFSNDQTWQVLGQTLANPTFPTKVSTTGFSGMAYVEEFAWRDDQVMDLTQVPPAPSIVPTFPPSLSSYEGSLVVGANRSFCLEANAGNAYVATCDASSIRQKFTWYHSHARVLGVRYLHPCFVRGASILSIGSPSSCLVATSLAVGDVVTTKPCDIFDDTQLIMFANTTV